MAPKFQVSLENRDVSVLVTGFQVRGAVFPSSVCPFRSDSGICLRSLHCMGLLQFTVSEASHKVKNPKHVHFGALHSTVLGNL